MDAGESDDSDADSTASSELLDFSDEDDGDMDADAVTGDIGRASSVGAPAERQFKGFESMSVPSSNV